MILVGRYDSPYVRRVGISLHLLAMSFELLPAVAFFASHAASSTEPDRPHAGADPRKWRSPHRECGDPRLLGRNCRTEPRTPARFRRAAPPLPQDLGIGNGRLRQGYCDQL